MDYTTLGKLPISEENPAGEDAKYDDAFEKVDAELSKLSSPSASNTVDWDLVVKLCEELLEHRSKHLLIAVYLSYALLRVRGIEGLNDGMMVLADLLENYWESMYPPLRRIKGRVNAIAWLLEKVTKFLENSENIETDSVTKEALLANLKRVDDFLNAQLEDAPLFYGLIKLADMKLVSRDDTVEEATPVQDQEPVVNTPSAVTPEVMQSSSSQAKRTEVPLSKPSLSGDREKDFEAMVNALNLLTGQMIETADYRSELFMINRAFAWLDIETLPVAQKGITMLPPPEDEEIELLQKLYDAKDYSTLLWAAESRITTYLFWLELHYYVAESLQQLGFKDASQMVLEQTRYFVRKLPGLQELSFSDKRPFANKKSKAWLKREEPFQGSSQERVAASSPAKQEKPACDTEGIDRLSYLILHSGSVEEEVLYNIEMCRCLAKGSNAILTRTYTQRLLERVDAYATQEWNPAIALDAYMVSVACLQSLEDAQPEELEALYAKIALLRPSLANSLEG